MLYRVAHYGLFNQDQHAYINNGHEAVHAI